MDELASQQQRVEELEQRLSRLSAASLRINEDLDFETTLQNVLDSARELTGARYGVIASMDQRGTLDAVLSSGTSEDEHDQLVHLPGGQAIFRHLMGIPNPMRLDDYGAYVSSVGLTGFLPMTVRAGMFTPVKHGGQAVGFICLGHDRPGRTFSTEDEETLVTFSAQAALVIVNARQYQDERRARDDLETLINISPVGVAVIDAATGAPRSLNREALRIADTLREADQSVEDMLNAATIRTQRGQELTTEECTLAERLGEGGKVRGEEFSVSAPDGRSVSILVNADPIRREGRDGGELESIIVTLQDLADVKELDRLRANFLAMVSHELRAPLTSIKGSASTVLSSDDERDPAVLRQFFRIIDEQADHMDRLVADLLDVARMESGELAVSPKPVEVSFLVDRARRVFNRSASHTLEIDLDPNLPRVLVDERRVLQVLGNLLANAERHAPASTPIRVRAVRDGVYVSFSVSNEGDGIPAEALGSLFEKFSRARSEEQGGDTGLGLAICKGIVEAHGGRIWAESQGPHGGALFTFTLPSVDEIQSAALVEIGTGEGDRPAEEQDRLRVLAVDDDPRALRYIRDCLGRTGFKPVVTGDPEEALHLMHEERPHLALLDLMLPGTDGVELMEKVLNIANVPVIFVSAYGREDLVARALDAGAVDYVVKPFSATELEARINAALRQRASMMPAEPYVYKDMEIDYEERRVTLSGEPIPLVSMEFRLLAELSANAGRIVTYEVLMERIWTDKDAGDIRPMRTTLSKLRRKLGDDAEQPTYIFTEPKVGYRMPRADAQIESPPENA